MKLVTVVSVNTDVFPVFLTETFHTKLGCVTSHHESSNGTKRILCWKESKTHIRCILVSRV